MMASPQLEDGYTRIANELLDAMCRLHLSGNEWMILHAIIRKTYGWNQKADWISGSQLAEMTGLHRSRVCEALRSLLDKHLILRDGTLLAIQKDYTSWDVTEKRNAQNVTEIRNGVTEIQTHLLRKSRHTKDNKDTIQKTGTHPAIDVFAELTGKRPRKHSYQYRAIVEAVTDNNAKVSQWRDVVRAWLLSDYRDTNLRGMLDWFRDGIPGKPADSNVIRVNPGAQI